MEILIILILILINGLFSMSEIALISSRKSALAQDVKKGSSSARTALKLAEEPDKFLSTIQIGITLIGILTGIYSGEAFAGKLGDIFISWGMGVKYAYPVAQVLIVLIVTYLTLVLGELVPKRIGMSSANKVAKAVAGPMKFLSYVGAPFIWLLSKSTSFLVNLLGVKSNDTKVTEEEIKSMIQEGTMGGEVKEVEQDIVERVFSLGDRTVDSIMTNRNEMIWIDIDATNEEITRIVEPNLHDVYPVAKDSLDEVVGVIYLKDLFGKLSTPAFCLKDNLKPVQWFHEYMDIYKVLQEMKDRQVGYGMIYDEYGNCQGIVTLKDILEGLVGTIPDSNEEPDIIKRKEGDGWLIDGQCPFYDFLEYFEKEDLYTENDDFNTIGGLIIDKLEHIPTTGEELKWNVFRFEIVDMDGLRIDKILVKIDKDPAEEVSD